MGYEPGALYEVTQVHGAAVVTVTQAAEPGRLRAEEADALVCARPGGAIGVRAADCATVLLADPRTGGVAALHAGWRGAVAGVVEATVGALCAEVGSARRELLAALFPCISRGSRSARRSPSSLPRTPNTRVIHTRGERGKVARLERAGARPYVDLAATCAACSRVPDCPKSASSTSRAVRSASARGSSRIGATAAATGAEREGSSRHRARCYAGSALRRSRTRNMGWFSKNRPDQDASKKRTLGAGVFRRCSECGVQLIAEEFSSNLEVCPHCQHHSPLSGEAWMEILCDPGSFEELDAGLNPKDFLGFTDAKKYADRIKSAQKATGLRDAFLSGQGQLAGRDIQIGTFMFRSWRLDGLGGGEKITRISSAGRAQQPVICSRRRRRRMQGGVMS